MEGFYLLLIVLSIAGIMGVQMTRKHVASAGDTAFKAFKRNYVVVLSLVPLRAGCRGNCDSFRDARCPANFARH